MMEQRFSLSEKVGEIAARVPQTIEVLRRHGIDFCCGGDRPLEQAAREHGADVSQLEKDLDEILQRGGEPREDEDWLQAPLGALLDHIVDTHHGYLRQVLPELADMAAAVLRAHGARHQELYQVHRLFNALKGELEAHLITEEEVLFPLIRKYEGEKGSITREMVETIVRLEKEHDNAGDVLKELRRVTGDYQVPADACGTYARMYQLLQELEGDIFQHIHLENNILHPRLRTIA